MFGSLCPCVIACTLHSLVLWFNVDIEMRLEAFGNNAMERVLWGLGLLLLKAGKHLVNHVFLKKLLHGITDKIENVEGNCIVCTSATLYICKISKWQTGCIKFIQTTNNAKNAHYLNSHEIHMSHTDKLVTISPLSWSEIKLHSIKMLIA